MIKSKTCAQVLIINTYIYINNVIHIQSALSYHRPSAQEEYSYLKKKHTHTKHILWSMYTKYIIDSERPSQRPLLMGRLDVAALSGCHHLSARNVLRCSLRGTHDLEVYLNCRARQTHIHDLSANTNNRSKTFAVTMYINNISIYSIRQTTSAGVNNY